MGLLAGLERWITERLEGGFARLFGGRLHPRAVARAVEDSVGLRPTDGGEMVANEYAVVLSTADYQRLAGQLDDLRREAVARVDLVAARQGWQPVGRVRVTVQARDDVPPGEVRVTADVALGPGEAELVSLAGEEHLHLTAHPVTIGRDPDCDLVLSSSDVSRTHARIDPQGAEYVIVDLGSTNGTVVNDTPITRLPLRDGDTIGFGPVQYVFREL